MKRFLFLVIGFAVIPELATLSQDVQVPNLSDARAWTLLRWGEDILPISPRCEEKAAFRVYINSDKTFYANQFLWRGEAFAIFLGRFDSKGNMIPINGRIDARLLIFDKRWYRIYGPVEFSYVVNPVGNKIGVKIEAQTVEGFKQRILSLIK